MKKDIFKTIYEEENGCHFNKQLLEYAQEHMTPGAKWTVEQTTQVAKDYNITFEFINAYDWNYTMNMVYSDYHGAVKDELDTYVRIAKAFLMDPDGPKGKAYKYFVAMNE